MADHHESAAGPLAAERPSAEMIVPFIMKFKPGDITPGRQTAGFTNVLGVQQSIELRRSEELIFEDFVGELMIAYVFDLPSYFQHVNREDCLDFGITNCVRYRWVISFGAGPSQQ